MTDGHETITKPTGATRMEVWVDPQGRVTRIEYGYEPQPWDFKIHSAVPGGGGGSGRVKEKE